MVETASTAFCETTSGCSEFGALPMLTLVCRLSVQLGRIPTVREIPAVRNVSCSKCRRVQALTFDSARSVPAESAYIGRSGDVHDDRVLSHYFPNACE